MTVTKRVPLATGAGVTRSCGATASTSVGMTLFWAVMFANGAALDVLILLSGYTCYYHAIPRFH